MSFAEVEKFYGQLAKKNAIGEALGKRIRSISSEPELQKFIQEEILPLSRKMGYDFSEKDLLEYEKVVARKLSDEDLLNVSGGISLKSALLSGGIFSLAMLGFGLIAPMQADAAVESVTGKVVEGAKEDANRIFETVKRREEAAQREQIQNAKNELADKLADTFLRKTENAQFMFNVAYFKRNLAEVFKYDQAGWLSLNQAGFELDKPTVRPETSPVFQYLINIYKDFYPASTIDCSNITWDDYRNICNILITFFNNNEIQMASSLLDECSTFGITFNEISENSIRAAINALRGEGVPPVSLPADKGTVIRSTGKFAKAARRVNVKKATAKETAVFAENYAEAKTDFFGFTGYEKDRDAVKAKIELLKKHGRISVFKEDGFTYILHDGKAMLALYEGDATEVTIPSKIQGCTVTKIGNYCFDRNKKIKKVTIPSTVEEIGEKAFFYCLKLASVQFAGESQLKTIKKETFRSCRDLSQITIPKSVERIEKNAFFSCSKLEKIDFEHREKTIFIEPDAFSVCPFSSITFPVNATFCDSYLALAKKLKTIKFKGNGEIIKEDILKFLPYDGAGKFFAHNIDKLFGGKDSISINSELEIDLWGGCLSEDGTLDLSQFDAKTFKTFKFARNTVVKRVIWPQGIDEIPEEMFSECKSLEEIDIPETVTHIGAAAFASSGLKEINIPTTVMNIDKNAFSYCAKLSKVTFERGRTENLFIGKECFKSCGLQEVTIPEKVSLDSKVFEYSSLEKIIIETEDESAPLGSGYFASELDTYLYSYDDDLKGTLKIYVQNEAMKNKLEEGFEHLVSPENIIVGLPQGNE